MLRLLFAIVLAASSITVARSQVVVVPPGPQIGSANPITAEPPVPRPPGVPCTVSLFSELEFADYNPKTFDYTPPANCPGPWAKVVFTADFTVTAGTQFDRTGAFYLGHANLFYGTTAEPSTSLSPSWHVERDVTDLTALFMTAQSGEADLGNFVGISGGVNYNGVIYANAALEFYPLAPGSRAPDTPDLVVPLPDAAGGAATLDSGSSQLSQTVNLPINTERVFLDVLSQSQSDDEFWYTCVPNDVAGELESCGNTAFRETEVSIDGQPAGVAPVYPWIYTGGIDPFLWQPITGVQTLDFKPYRVDLTPFAGLLGNGQTHTVAISVYNADNYFLATANLLVYTDHGAAQVTGGVLSNSLTAAPSPIVKEHLTTNPSGNINGGVVVSSSRHYVISGYVDTSHGRVETSVDSRVDFENLQTFVINASSYIQNITQTNTVDSSTTVSDGASVNSTHTQLSYPFTFAYSYVVAKTGASAQATSSDQQYLLNVANSSERSPAVTAEIRSEVKSADILHFDSGGNFTGNSGQTSSAEDQQSNSQGYCFDRSLSAAKGVLTAVKNSLGCAAGDVTAR
jgi:hypothetical protein